MYYILLKKSKLVYEKFIITKFCEFSSGFERERERGWGVVVGEGKGEEEVLHFHGISIVC